MMKLRVLTATAVVCVASCGSPWPFGTSEDIELVELGRLPPPPPADLSVDSRPYLIGPFDKLRVDVFGVEELSGEVQADASGRISVPTAGTSEESSEERRVGEGGVSKCRYWGSPELEKTKQTPPSHLP